MSRQLKFRGKRVDNGKWVYGLFANIDVHECGKDYEETVILKQLRYDDRDYYVNEFIDADEVDLETVGQYTGLKDKNGVEIYEGDILKVVFGNDEWEEITTVKWYGESGYPAFDFYLENSECNNFSLVSSADGYSVEIIGNLHDNPELMEVER